MTSSGIHWEKPARQDLPDATAWISIGTSSHHIPFFLNFVSPNFRESWLVISSRESATAQHSTEFRAGKQKRSFGPLRETRKCEARARQKATNVSQRELQNAQAHVVHYQIWMCVDYAKYTHASNAVAEDQNRALSLYCSPFFFLYLFFLSFFFFFWRPTYFLVLCGSHRRVVGSWE